MDHPLSSSDHSLVLNLHAVAAAMAEHVERAAEGVECERVFDQRGEAVDALAEIHGLAVQVDIQRGVELEHGHPVRASIMVFRSVLSAPPQESSRAMPLRRRARRLGAVSGSGRGGTGVDRSFTHYPENFPE